VTDSSRISQTFDNLKAAGHKAFMPYIAAGDPDLATTAEIIKELSSAGVDLIEVGFPYSDPIADGPVIQASYTRALDKGLKVEQIFETVQKLTTAEDSLPPLVAMVSFAIIFRVGPEAFIKKAEVAGFSGLIVPDLPGDEAEEFAALISGSSLDLVQLIAPTTPDHRVEKILNTASGFLYCISVAGITGARDELPPELNDQLRDLRSRTDLPLAVGFGISKPEQVDILRDVADGIIVGSAIVRHLENVTDDASKAMALKAIRQMADGLVAATHRS
jgi:tryptophan synthase alpha chain